MLGTQLDGDERRQQHRRQGQAGEGDAGGPTVLGRPGEPVDQGDQTGRHAQRARDVVARIAMGPALADHRGGGDGGENGDGYVDEQAPTPGGELGEHTAEDEADGGAPAGDRTVDTEGGRPLLDLGEGHRDERESCRSEQRTEGALQGAGAEEHRRVDSHAAESRCAGEAEQPEDEGALAPDIVGDAAAEQQQATEGQGVGGDHPLAVGRRDVQRALGRGEGDRHDGRVEHHHQLGDGDDGQGQPAPGIGPGGGTGPGHGRRGLGERGHGGSLASGRI